MDRTDHPSTQHSTRHRDDTGTIVLPRPGRCLMAASQPRPCGTCQGAGGHTVDTSSGGVTRQNWQPCGTCRGSGTAS